MIATCQSQKVAAYPAITHKEDLRTASDIIGRLCLCFQVPQFPAINAAITVM